MNESTVNLNAANCIKATSNFGETVYHNICNGSINHVPWGGADWFAAAVCFGFVAILTALFLILLGGLVKAVFA